MTRYALMFVIGAWALQQCSELPSWYALVAASLLASGLIVKRKKFKSSRIIQSSIVLGATLILGFGWAGVFAKYRLADDLPHAWERKSVQLIGVVAEIPHETERGVRFVFDVEQVLTKDAQVPRHISLSHYHNPYNAGSKVLPRYQPGERWRLMVRLKRPHTTYNPHSFDFEAWALERNIRAIGYVRASTDNQRLSDFVPRFGYMLEALRSEVALRMQAALEGKTYAGILIALAIGDDDAISAHDWQVLLNTGTNHLMSISGLHITMLSGLVFGIAFWLWRQSEMLMLAMPARKAATALGLLTALTYAMIAGFSVPTQRTLYMLTVFAFALWANRRIEIVTVLAYALFVVTLLDPWAVIAPGFWLSFGAIAVMAFALGGRVGQMHWLKSTIISQWAVTIGLLPFLLVLFGQVSLVSPFANAFAIPLISLIIVPLTLLGALLGIDWPLHLAHILMDTTMQGLQWLANLPIATWQQQAPPVWSLPLALFGAAWMLLPRGFPLRWLGVFLLLPMLFIKPNAPAYGGLQLALLDVGQGLAAVIRTQRHVLVYDTGPRYSEESDAGGRVLWPYLRGESMPHVDGIMVSHNDIDHSGGLESLLQSARVGWVLGSAEQEVALEQAQSLDAARYHMCHSGQRWEWDGVRFEVLYPAKTQYRQRFSDNNMSCVLKISSSSGSVLLTGDIEREAETIMLETLPEAQLRADVLTAPHHGSKTSSSPDFIGAVQPKITIFSAGYHNRFNHPKTDIVTRYLQGGSRVYRSDHHGAVLIDMVRHDIALKTWRQTRARYWHDDYTF